MNTSISDLPDELKKRILPIRMMIFDVDGVLTDGRVIYSDDGSEIKEFDVQDGHGIKLLQRAGIEVALITGRACRAVGHRALALGITRVHQGAKVKLEPYEKLLAQTGFKEQETGYMGDDLIDIPVMRTGRVFGCCPKRDAAYFSLRALCDQGRRWPGAAREVCEMILQVQGLWESTMRRYLG